ncbi:MAG: hypothetical protein ACFB51_18735 [Anaerolineae bacterium]
MSAENKRMVPGVLLIALGVFFLASQYINFAANVIMPAIAAGVVSVGFIAYYFTGPEENRWALIPAYIAAAIGGVIIAENWLGFDVGILVPLVVAVPFFVVFLLDRENNWWALIPAYVLTSVTVVLIAQMLFNVDFAPLIPLMIALPFYVLFFVDTRDNWWALIPAYALTAGAVMVGVDAYLDLDVAGLAPLLVALPFYVVFLRSRDSWWALIPAGVLTVASVAVLIDEGSDWIIPLLLIAGGLFLLFGGLKGSRAPVEVAVPPAEEQPVTGPAADRPPQV